MELTLSLNDSYRFEVQIPTIYNFSDDELEIWLTNSNHKKCIFKDSCRDVLLTEVAHVINKFRLSDNSYRCDPNCLAERYYNYRNSSISDDDLFNHLLFEHKNVMVWLSADKNDNALISIIDIEINSELSNYLCSNIFLVPRSSFLNWVDKLLSLGTML